MWIFVLAASEYVSLHMLYVWLTLGDLTQRALCFGSGLNSHDAEIASSSFGIFCCIFIFPTIEEWLFRRELIDYLAPRTRPWLAIILSSALFSATHTQYSLPPID